MKIIIVNKKSGSARSFSTSGLLLGLTVASLLGFPAAVGYFSYLHGIGEAAQTAEMFGKLREVLRDQDRQVKFASREARENLEASALRLAKLQARIIRLDALGERLTNVAKLDEGEFDFSSPPALGGPLIETGEAVSPMSYLDQLNRLADDIDNREQQLGVLETLLF
ncbi:MAG: hypothetical protein JKY88_07395, partial [Pseudomonadales bacterium]|nr:hypothetical protein [Pseudomonadales bacterium]